MAEAEPPDKEFCFLLPLTVKYREEHKKFKQLSKDQYKTLYKHLNNEIRLLQKNVPFITDFTFADSSDIKIVCKILRNEKALCDFYDFVKKSKDGQENELEKELRRSLNSSSIELELGLGLNTDLKINVSVDKKEYEKKQKELKTDEKDTPIEPIVGGTRKKDNDFWILLPLTVAYKDKGTYKHLSKERYKGLCKFLEKDLAALHEHICRIEGLSFVKVCAVTIAQSGAILMECKIPKNEITLCQFYDCTQKYDDQRENILEREIRYYLRQSTFSWEWGSTLDTEIKISVNMSKRDFHTKQLELVEIDEMSGSVDDVPKAGQFIAKEEKHRVRDTVNRIEHKGKIQEHEGKIPETSTQLPGSYPRHEHRKDYGSSPQPEAEVDTRLGHEKQDDQLVRSVTKTIIVYVPLKPGETINSLKMYSKYKHLDGKDIQPHNMKSHLYKLTVNLLLTDATDVDYFYTAKIRTSGYFTSSVYEKTSNLFMLNHHPVQRDIFSGLNVDSFIEHLVDIFHSPGDDSENMNNSITEINNFLLGITCEFGLLKQLMQTLVDRTKERKTSKSLFLIYVVVGRLLSSIHMLKRIGYIDCRFAESSLNSFREFRLRQLNPSCDAYMRQICYTLSEICLGKNFCLLSFMNLCYPFLDESHFNEILNREFSENPNTRLVLGDENAMFRAANKMCAVMYKLCYNDNVESQAKVLLRRIFLHLPVRISLRVASDLQLMNPSAAATEKELQQDINEIVINSLKGEIMRVTKERNIHSLFELWQYVRSSSFPISSFMTDAFEKPILDFIGTKTFHTETLTTNLLKFLDDQYLFTLEHSRHAILDILSESMMKSLHSIFLILVRRDKFASVCTKDNCHVWLKRAIKTHQTGGEEHEVSHMYSALADLLSVKSIWNNVELKGSLQEDVFKRLEKYNLVNILKQMTKIEHVIIEKPDVEGIFDQHIATLMQKKLVGQRPVELLESVCTNGNLRVNSRVTARTVILILNEVTQPEEPTDDCALFKEMVLNFHFWKLLFEGSGKTMGLIENKESYKKASSCLQQLRQKFFDSNITYSFLGEYQERMKLDALDLLRMNCRPSFDFSKQWRAIEQTFEKQIETIEVTNNVFKCLIDHVPDNDLPLRFQRLYQEIRSYEQDVKTKLPSNKLQEDGFAQNILKELAPICLKIEHVTKSKVFWNVGLSKVIDEFKHCTSVPMIEDVESDDDITISVANLFIEFDTNESSLGSPGDTEYKSTSEVIYFFKIVLETGSKLYKEEWVGINEDSDFQLEKCFSMFEGVSCEKEIEIAERYLNFKVTKITKQTLHRLQSLLDIKKTVQILKQSLKSLRIEQHDDEEFFYAVESFEKLLSGDSSSYTFREVSEALRTVYEITDPLGEDTISVLEAIGESSKLIEFLQSIVDDDIRNLIDAVEDISEQHVQETTVSSLIEIKRFLYPLLRSDFEKRAQSVFNIIHKQTCAHGKAASSIPVKIDDCMNNLHNLKSLYNNVANRSEQTKETIQNIVKVGRFDFTLDKENSECPFRASYSVRKNKTSHSRPVLFDLRSRALLLMNKREAADGLQVNELETFIGYIDRCSEISELVMCLHSTGHIKYKRYKIVKEAASLNDLKNSLQSEYDGWVDHLEKVRKSYYLVNFLQGSQIFILHNYLAADLSKVDSFSSQAEVETLLKFIHPDIGASSLKEVYEQEQAANGSFDEYSFILCIGRILNHCCETLELFERSFEGDIGKTIRMTDVVQAGKLFVAHLEDSSLLVVKTILTLFFNTVNRLPEPNQVLICSRQTTWSEIDLLIRRCLGSFEYFGENVLFCIANVEALPNELQFKLVGALRNLDKTTRYLFAVVCRGSKNHPFVDELNEYVFKVRPISDKVMEQIVHNECPDVTSITSVVAGLGKTTHINKTAFLSARSLKTLHVSGAFDKDELICRLQALNIDESNMLHVDVGTLGNSVEFDIFLFELIVLRFVMTGRNSVHLQTSFVAIEIANSLQDSLRASLQTAVSFKRLHLAWRNFDDYIVSREIHSPIQVVCHFLHELERDRLDTTDIQFNGVNCVKALSTRTCRTLLMKHFPTTANMSFCMVNIFLNVLSDQLKKMSNSSFLRTGRIKDMIGNKSKPSIRSSLVRALIEVSKEFSARSVDTYRATQLSTLEGSFNSEGLSREKDFASSAVQRTGGMIQWEDSNHLMYVFHNQNIQTLSPVYRDKNKVPDYIKSLFESQMKKELQDYKKMSQPELQVILQKVSRSNPLMLKDSTLHDLAKDYALTPDNLLKMILIMLRIKANIPVLIMGETGCGKTSLIRYLASICEVEFDVLNIHAGVEKQSIVDKIVSCNVKATEHLDKEHWLFFDEINTSEYVGLISDMICHKTFSGHRLAPNLVLMGACNPYKLRSSSAVSTAGLKGKVLTDELSRLVYRVLPLPEMLVDYVWDFGSLDIHDERLYISRMTESVFYDQRKYHALFTDLLSMSQIFIRGKEETTCSVSLRDVKRCKTLAVWFMDILEMKRSITASRRMMFIRMNKHETAIVLSLAHCYHSRISDVEGRKTYRQGIADVFKKHGPTFTEGEIDSVIKSEQNDILNRMELPPGTAKNTALRENVFVLLVCILNKIPIFVVGKPGCSKSLSMQVIRSNLRGGDSKDEFFKQLPQLYCVSFQGSESSTSDGIIKVFEKAEKYQESNQLDDVSSVVILDEIGLAEVSRFNPLKVLHNLLEPDGRDRPNVAVVGISNWSLDASKMNRAIHLSRPDMDENELFETGVSIFDSFVVSENPELRNALFTLSSKNASPQLKTEHFQGDLENIAKSYSKYSKIQTFPNFHGLRDYYSLVKYFAKEMTKNSNITDEEKRTLILKGLERNFGGLPAERSTLLSVFNFNGTNQPCDVIELIGNNVEDEMARHLMLITTGESVLGLLDQILDDSGRENRELIFGSQFEEDLTDDYNYRILNRIIICMEQGVVLILKDLESIYGSLYDMLNQNYTIIGKKKNCRVALGPYSNPICHVATTFRCIVIVDDSKLKYSDPPFLNRFEKQHLRFSDIISPRQNHLINKMELWVQNLCVLDYFDEADAFPIYGDDMISSLILKYCRDDEFKGAYDETTVLEKCKRDLLWIIRPEAVIRVRNNQCEDIKYETEQLLDAYFDLPVHGGIEGLLDFQFDDDNSANLTDTRLMTVVFTNSNIHTKVLQSVNRWSLQVEKLGSFKSEKQLSLRMQTFWLESTTAILILQCSAVDDEKHIMLAKSVIERYRQEYLSTDGTSQAKHVYFVIHMDRSKGRSNILSQINFLSSWALVTLDSLERQTTLLPKVCTMSLHDALLDKRPFNDYMKEQLFWAFTRIKYSEAGRSIDSIRDLMLQIQSSEKVLEILDQLVYLWLQMYFPDIDDMEWQTRVACDNQALRTSSSFIEALENYISQIIRVPLAKFIYKMESECILDAFFVDDESSTERIGILTKVLFDNRQFSIANIPEETGPESYICSAFDLKLKMPFSKILFESIETTRDEFLYSVKMLKGRCGIEPEDDLPEEILLELEKKQDLVVCQQIPLVVQLSYESALKDYVEDFCNIVSFTISPRLPVKQRLKFTQWILSDFLRLRGKDFSAGIVSTHIVFWTHSTLFTSQLKLLETCTDLLTKEDLVKLNILEQNLLSVKISKVGETNETMLDFKKDNTGEEGIVTIEHNPTRRLDITHKEGSGLLNSTIRDECILDTERQHDISFHTPEKEVIDLEITNDEDLPVVTPQKETGISQIESQTTQGPTLTLPPEREIEGAQQENESEHGFTLTTSDIGICLPPLETVLKHDSPSDETKIITKTPQIKPQRLTIKPTLEINELDLHLQMENITDGKLSFHDETSVEQEYIYEKIEYGVDINDMSQSNLTAEDIRTAETEPNVPSVKTDDKGTLTETKDVLAVNPPVMKEETTELCSIFVELNDELTAIYPAKDMYTTNQAIALTEGNETFGVSYKSEIGSDLLQKSPSDNGKDSLDLHQHRVRMSISGKESLVQIVCMKLLPTKATLQHYKNIKSWQIQVNSALTLVGKIYPESQCIHYLRICSDILSTLILPNDLDSTSIEHLASCIQTADTLDSEDVFHALCDIVNQPLSGSETARQRILSEYFLRCLISDSESQALSRLMKLVYDSELPDSNVSVFKQVIKLALDYETDEEEDIYFRILECGLSDTSAEFPCKAEDTSDTESDDESERERPLIICLNTLFKRLDKNGMNGCPFLILIIDIFEDIFADHFSKLEDGDTEYFGSMLDMLVLAQKIITEGIFNLQFVIACGFFKACVKYLVYSINPKNSKHNDYINAIMGNKTKVYIKEYVWKVLVQEKIASSLRTYLEELKDILPNVVEIPCSDEYVNNSIDRCPLFVFVKSPVEHTIEGSEISSEGSLNKTFEDIVSKLSTSKECLLLLFGYAERIFYIPRSYSLLDDKTKTLADSVFKIAKDGGLNDISNSFLQCLLGKEDFRITNFMHSEQSPSLDRLLNGFFVSLYALSITYFRGLDSMPFFQVCLHNPTEIEGRFVPGYPDDLSRIHTLRSHEQYEVRFAVCSCHHRLAVFDNHPEDVPCPVCNSCMTKWRMKDFVNKELESALGFSLNHALNKRSYSARNVSPLSCQILFLITKGCLLGFLALSKGRPEQLEKVLSVPANEISSTLWNEVEEHWRNIGTLLGVGEHTVGLYLHAVLLQAQESLFITCPEMKTQKDRYGWEREFELVVQDVTQNRYTRQRDMIQHHHTICGVKTCDFEDRMLEIDEVDSTSLAACLRIKSQPSFENFLSELFPVQQKYPILEYILTRELDLLLSSHILSIMKWHIAVVSTANYTIRKHECLVLTVVDFIQQLGDKEKSDMLRKRFGELQKSWSELVDLSKRQYFPYEMTRIHSNLKMEDCIIHDLDCLQYKVLEYLVGVQNTFLDDVLSVANHCESVKFLMRSERTAVFPCIGISDVTSAHLLGKTDASTNWHELLDDKAHCYTSYGQGKMIWYDFQSIETILADRILVGRAFIDLNSIPKIVFTDELYKNYVSLSQDIKTKVEQKLLSSDMKASLIDKQKNDIRISKELLMQIGMIMTLVNKTGGDPDKCLIDYVEEMKNTLTKKFSDDLLPSPSSAVKLCHIVALYELLEELNADSIVEALGDQFRQELDMDLVNHFDDLIKRNTRLGTYTLSACKRFVNRCLSLREADETRPLLDYVSDDSFWPEGVKSGSCVRHGDSTEQVEKVIPKDVMVNHIYCLVSLISSKLENQRMERMEMSKMATSWQSSHMNKPVVKEIKKQKTAVKKRRNIRL